MRLCAGILFDDELLHTSARPAAVQYIAVRLSRRKNGTSTRPPVVASPLTECQAVTTIRRRAPISTRAIAGTDEPSNVVPPMS